MGTIFRTEPARAKQIERDEALETQLRLVSADVFHDEVYPTKPCTKDCPACRLKRVRLALRPCRCVGFSHREECAEWELPL
jgi:hypothetical protein